MLLLLLFITGITSEELPTPSSLLGPQYFNYHPYQVRQFLEETKVEPTKQGPVLFPNDAPPPPRPPLIVTARPLIESIARSELNPNPPNNSIAEPSQINKETIQPDYVASANTFLTPDLLRFANGNRFQGIYNVPLGIGNARVNDFVRNNDYDGLEEQTALPPIYKALSEYANQKVLNLQKTPRNYDYQPKNVDYQNHYENNKISDDIHNTEYDENQNYAFSYTVKDRKTGDDFSHSQQSSGSATNGEYRVRLPDGRTQIVSYTADENGYKANVRYDDEQKDNRIDNYDDIHNGDNNFKYNKNYNNFNNVNKVNKKIYDPRDSIPIKEDSGQYNSNEYYDYSSDYNQNYNPYRSKFSLYKPTSTVAVASTVKPSYELIKDLFTRSPINYVNERAVEINGPSTVKYDSTTENLVAIGNKLHTNVRNLVFTTAKPVFVASTPASYLASTIASLRDRITAKPVLSESFINRINKYLSFK